MASLRLAVLLISWASRPSRGEVYELKGTVLPAAKSLQVLYAFYVMRPEEASVKPAEDPIDQAKPPYVKFEGLQPNITLADMKGIELSLVTSEDLQGLIKQGASCSAESKLSVVGVSHEVKFDGKPNVNVAPQPLEGGIYYLVLSNCGDSSKAAINGNVVVKNPYGFLPGDQFFKKQFYGWLSVAYGFLACVWLAMIVRYYVDIWRVHNCILIVLAIGLAHVVTAYFSLCDLNASGYSKHFLVCFCDMLAVSKSAVAYMATMAVCSGWGVTSEDIDNSVRLKLHCVSLVFMPITYFAQSMLRFRHTQRFAENFMFASVASVVLANTVVLVWTFSCLGETSEKLRQRNYQKSLAQFDTIWRILCFSVALSAGPIVAQVLDIMQREQLPMWQYQWFFQEGMSGMVFLLILVLMMCAWAPGNEVLDYSFTAVQMEEGSKEEAEPVVWADEEEEGDGGYGVKPETYGSRANALDE